MSQTLQASTLLAVPLAPLVGSALAGILGTRLGGNWIGRTLSHSLTILGVLVAFVLSAMTLYSVAVDGARFNETLYTWMVVGGLKMEVGFLIDGLTAMMMCVVTFVSLMVHLYTIGYMEEDDGYNRFFAYISLFTFSMLMLVMSNNMLQLFFGWEAVGLVSYLLIGFWFNKPSAVFANMKAFLVNRVGDFGFILGIGLIAAYAGTLNYAEAFAKAGELGSQTFPGTDWMLVTVPLLLLAIPSVVIGYLTIEPMLYGDFFKDAIVVDADKHHVMKELAEAFHGPLAMAAHAFSTLPFWLALSGVVVSYYMYMVNPAVPAAIKRACQPLYTLLENKYYMDWINENILARGARALGTGLWRGGDQALIDGAVVNGSWKIVGWVSSVARRLQSGYLYHYALVMILGVFVLMTWFVWLKP
ncbi:MAG: hypothetical protein EB096_01295 [Betaproteobacteria bacterium]|nr:hypothetical protein [Betaproteobacteria bacterium]